MSARDEHTLYVPHTGVSVAFGTWSAGAFVRFYVCAHCGYLEMYVEDEADSPKNYEK